MREGYGTWFVVHSFVRSVHRAAETIAHFWNSVKVWTGLARQWLAMWLVDFAKVLSFSSFGWLTLTSLTTKAPIVDYLGTCRFHLNCRTALGVRRHLKKKPIKAKSNGYLLSVHGHAHLTHLVLVVSTRSVLCCLLVSSAISIASRFAFSCKAPSANHN